MMFKRALLEEDTVYAWKGCTEQMRAWAHSFESNFLRE